jgi:Zn-dependent protease
LRWRFPIARFRGTPLTIHWTWPLACAWWVAFGPSTTASAWLRTSEIVGIFAIVLLHELGHVIAGRWRGFIAKEVVLTPLGGLAMFDPTPSRRRDVLVVVGAGPLVNLVLVAPLSAALYFSSIRFGAGAAFDLFGLLLVGNVLLLVFNLLPIVPLDGGRLTRACLSSWMSASASEVAVSITSFLCSTAVLLFAVVAGDVLTASIAIVVLFGSVRAFNWHLYWLRRERQDGIDVSAACPKCHEHPPRGMTARCPNCQATVIWLGCNGVCWNCGQPGGDVQCIHCYGQSSCSLWFATNEPPKLS